MACGMKLKKASLEIRIVCTSVTSMWSQSAPKHEAAVIPRVYDLDERPPKLPDEGWEEYHERSMAAKLCNVDVPPKAVIFPPATTTVSFKHTSSTQRDESISLLMKASPYL